MKKFKLGASFGHQRVKREQQPDMAVFAARTRACMKNAGIGSTDKDLFYALPRGFAGWSVIERLLSGKAKSGVGTVLSIKLAKFFGVCRYWLLGFSDRNTPKWFTGPSIKTIEAAQITSSSERVNFATVDEVKALQEQLARNHAEALELIRSLKVPQVYGSAETGPVGG